jgi:myxalamid-type nonribosomal peptide synthetase MxaA
MIMLPAVERFKERLINPEKVFFTGITGYVGAFLAEALLRDTDAEIFALVRAKSEQDGFDRIRDSMKMWQAWNDEYAGRIHAVPGDLGEPKLGLSDDRFAELAKIIDAIYHNGALVNFSYPYSVLKGPNVQGTQEIVRLACQARPKALHYMSTIDSLAAAHMPRPWLEVDPPMQPRRDAPDGYMLSKWASEVLLIAARDRGVPVTIYRPTWIIGHTETGAAPNHNFLLMQLKCYLELGIFPEVPANEPYDGAPVDYIARSVVHLSRQPDSIGKIFHPWAPNRLDFDEIYECLAELGYTFDVVSREQVLERLKCMEPTNAFYPLVPLIERIWGDPSLHHGELYGRDVECANAIAGLSNSGIECPPIDRGLVKRCILYMIENGSLNPPPSAGSGKKSSMLNDRP